MILELDCGNSFIKWRILSSATGLVSLAGVDECAQGLALALAKLEGVQFRACRLVSVRGEAETASLCRQLASLLGVDVVVAQPARELAGVSNGYEDFSRLGMDRWLAVLGAYQLSAGAALVLDLGTAITADYIQADGRHLGGFICPGLPLMRDQLGSHTRRVRYSLNEIDPALGVDVPGRSTADAVERGCLQMLQSFVLRQVSEAKRLLGDNCSIYLTGGDAGLVSDLIPGACVTPDLVFVGLSVACPLD